MAHGRKFQKISQCQSSLSRTFHKFWEDSKQNYAILLAWFGGFVGQVPYEGSCRWMEPLLLQDQKIELPIKEDKIEKEPKP